MYTQDEFLKIIEQRTGWTHGNPDKLFGFIAGTSCPYERKAMQSSSRRVGFTVWKKAFGIGIETNIESGTPDEMINTICDFLNAPFPEKDAQGRAFRTVGEFGDV